MSGIFSQVFRCGILLPLTVIALYVDEAQGSDQIERIEGRWQVTEAHINMGASWTPAYQWNDPSLVGRLFNFSHAAIDDDTPESTQCLHPRLRSAAATLDEAINKSMGKVEDSSIEHPNASDYKIKLTDTASPTVYRVYCDTEIWHGGLGTHEFMGIWLIPMRGDRLLIRWFGETLLILARVPWNLAPQPSFSCARARSRAEIAICSSYQLSAFDRSVVNAYGQLLQELKNTDGSTEVAARGQVAWLHSRDRCGAEESCLLKSMQDRLDAIASIRSGE